GVRLRGADRGEDGLRQGAPGPARRHRAGRLLQDDGPRRVWLPGRRRRAHRGHVDLRHDRGGPGVTAVATTSPSTVEGTVMFTDIVGFTEFNALRGDVEALEMLAAQEDIVRGELGDGARIVKQLGDG